MCNCMCTCVCAGAKPTMCMSDPHIIHPLVSPTPQAINTNHFGASPGNAQVTLKLQEEREWREALPILWCILPLHDLFHHVVTIGLH